MDTERTCGDCQACCEVLHIASLHKKPRQRCPNQCDTGCAIYGSHPPECQQYQCAWLAGFGPADARPNSTGLLLEAATLGTGLVAIVAWPVHSSDSGNYLTTEMRARAAAFVRKGVAVWGFASADELFIASEDDADLKQMKIFLGNVINGNITYHANNETVAYRNGRRIS